VRRDGAGTLGAQIEDQIRRAIRAGALRPGAALPSTRDLARQLGVSRRIAVDAYAQLAAEGYLALRQGARATVRDAAAAGAPAAAPAPAPARARFDFRPSVPDVSMFPRTEWLRSLRRAVATLPDADLGYGDPAGVASLRAALAEYLGRVRGVAAEPERIVVTSGYSQALGLVCRALHARGAHTIAIEDPSNPEQRLIAQRGGLEPVSLAVDARGARVEDVEGSAAAAVVLTPAHQHPLGVVLDGARRAWLLGWLRRHDAFAVEDDYDAEYRYDRAAVGALQGLDPERVVYAGSVSKTLAPALRLGWLVLPPDLVEPVRREKLLADQGSARIDQHAFADFLARGRLDRHLRRMRARYRGRRDALVAALAEELPQARVGGIAAGLHLAAGFPAAVDEDVLRDEAARRRIAFTTMRDYRATAGGGPTLFLGYAQMPEPAIRAGVRELAVSVRAAS
jgi:GntR family transcriptional regulator / MocR family aminotransferase